MASNIIWEEKGTLVKHSGTVTNEEVMEMNNIMYGDIRFESITYQIADYTKVTDNLITAADAKVIGTLDRTASVWSSKRMRLAVVTTDEKFVPIVKTYFKEFEGTEWVGRIFETLELAYDWVKSECPYVSPSPS